MAAASKVFCGSCVVFLVHGTILQQWTSLLKNSARIKKEKILFVTVEESCQPPLSNLGSDCWRIISATVEERIVPAIVEQSCQWLLENCANDCWWIVSTAVEQSCQLFFFLFLTYFGKILTSFSITTISASRLLISNYLHIFIIHVLPTFVTFQKLNQTQ